MMNKTRLFPLIILFSLSPLFAMEPEENRDIEQLFSAIDVSAQEWVQTALAAAIAPEIQQPMYWFNALPSEIRNIILTYVINAQNSQEAIAKLRTCASVHKKSFGYLFLPPRPETCERIIIFFNWVLDYLATRDNQYTVWLIKKLGPNAALAYFERIKFPGAPEIPAQHLWKMAQIINGGDDDGKECPSLDEIVRELKRWIEQYHPEYWHNPSVQLYIAALFSEFERDVYGMPLCRILIECDNKAMVQNILGMIQSKPGTYFEKQLLSEVNLAFQMVAFSLSEISGIPNAISVDTGDEIREETLYLLSHTVLVKKVLERAGPEFFEKFLNKAMKKDGFSASIFWRLAFFYGYSPSSEMVRTIIKKCSYDTICLLAMLLKRQWRDEEGNTLFHVFIQTYKNELIDCVTQDDYSHDAYDKIRETYLILHILGFINNEINHNGSNALQFINHLEFRDRIAAMMDKWKQAFKEELKVLGAIPQTKDRFKAVCAKGNFSSLIFLVFSAQASLKKIAPLNFSLQSELQEAVLRTLVTEWRDDNAIYYYMGFLLALDYQPGTMWDQYLQLYNQKKDDMSEIEFAMFCQMLLQKCFKTMPSQ